MKIFRTNERDDRSVKHDKTAVHPSVEERRFDCTLP